MKMAQKQPKTDEILKVLERLDIQIYALKAKFKELEGLILEQNNLVFQQKRQLFQQNVAINEVFKQVIKHIQEQKP